MAGFEFPAAAAGAGIIAVDPFVGSPQLVVDPPLDLSPWDMQRREADRLLQNGHGQTEKVLQPGTEIVLAWLSGGGGCETVLQAAAAADLKIGAGPTFRS